MVVLHENWKRREFIAVSLYWIYFFKKNCFLFSQKTTRESNKKADSKAKRVGTAHKLKGSEGLSVWWNHYPEQTHAWWRVTSWASYPLWPQGQSRKFTAMPCNSKSWANRTEEGASGPDWQNAQLKEFTGTMAFYTSQSQGPVGETQRIERTERIKPVKERLNLQCSNCSPSNEQLDPVAVTSQLKWN